MMCSIGNSGLILIKCKTILARKKITKMHYFAFKICKNTIVSRCR